MSINRRFALQLISAALLVGVSASPGRAQTQTPTQTVTVNISIPFTISKLDPSIYNLDAICEIYAGTTRLVQSSGGGYVPLSSFTKAADGTITGTLPRTFSVPVPTTAAGQAGRYACQLGGQGNGVGAGTFTTYRTDRFKTLASPDSVWGSFVW